MGGAGKTPVASVLAKILLEKGFQPHILTRGYGGYFRSPMQVCREKHSYVQVGDEALLLSRICPTWVGKDRVKTAKEAIKNGASCLIMDDGFQNASLYKNISFLVVDSLQGFGNQKVFPAGPLRENIDVGLNKADAVVLVGEHKNITIHKAPLFKAKVRQVFTTLTPQPIIAFAGIGFPEKFYQSLKRYGFTLKKKISFPDHYPYTVTDMSKLIDHSRKLQVPLVTTEKDFIRIPDMFKKQVHTVPLELEFEDFSVLKKFIIEKIGIAEPV
jgi:tetraacyldisaccharide 4'-kinase